MKRFLCFLLIILFSLSGCSSTQLHNTISEIVGEEEKVVHTMDQVGYGEIVEESDASRNGNDSETENAADSEPETDPEVQIIDGMTVIIRGCGESFDGYVIYDDKSGEKTTREVRGTEGIIYTLNSVTVYDNFYDSGVELNDSITEPDGSLNDYNTNLIDKSSFILAEMSATYTAPSGGENQVTVHTGSDFEVEYFEEFTSDKLIEDMFNNVYYYPNYKWFSIGEQNQAERDKIQSTKGSHNFVISDGETVNFKIGVFAAKELVDTKNIYLCINWFPPYFFKNYNHKYFALFPDE